MLPGFPETRTETDGGRFRLALAGETLTFYSARSAVRDLRQFESLLEKNGTIPLIVAPYYEALKPLFESKARFYFFAPATFTRELPDDARLVADENALVRFINSAEKDDKFTVHILPQWQSCTAAVHEAVMQVLTRVAVRLKTIGHFGRLWTINFRVNAPLLMQLPDIRHLTTKYPAPDALVLAGPSLDRQLQRLYAKKTIWCADTALPVLRHYGIEPLLVFTVDAGFASNEHFCSGGTPMPPPVTALVCDPLCYPAIMRLPFAERYIYASSHPLLQNFCAEHRPDLTPIDNREGNVGALMQNAAAILYPNAKPEIFGRDGGHRRHITHARGTAYFRRAQLQHHRLSNIESYSLVLSRRYGAATNTG